MQAIDDVAFVTDPFAQPGRISPDGRIALATATYEVEPLSLRANDREELFAAGDAGREAGLQVEFSGTAAVENQPESHLGELIGVAVAAVVLLVTFGSIVAAGLPLLTALVGIGIGMAGITTLTRFVELSSNRSWRSCWGWPSASTTRCSSPAATGTS